MSVVVYEYAKCSTCRNALKWLEKHQVKFRKVPIVEEPPKLSDLKNFMKLSGLPLSKFFNTSGQVYREMKLTEKLPNMTEDEMLKLLAANGKLIKRPLLVDTNSVLVGFNEAAYQKHFHKK